MNEILNLIPIAIGIATVIVSVTLIVKNNGEHCEFGNDYCKECVYYESCKIENKK